MLKKLAKLDRKYAAGFVIAVVLGIIAIYVDFFRDTLPHLTYEIFGNTTVLDIKEELNKLDILYEGIDIRKQKQTLSVITLRVTNEGKQAILRSYYDTRDPLGVGINDGKIIKAEVLDATNPYLKNNLILQIVDSSVLFSDVIFDPTESFTIKLLILHALGTKPTVFPTGKVANVRSVVLVDRLSGDSEKGFWSEVFSGSITVNLVRLPIFFFGFFVVFVGAMLIFVLPIVLISDRVGRRKRKKIVAQFKKYNNVSVNNGHEAILNFYIEHDVHALTKSDRLLTSKDRLKKMLTEEDKGKNPEAFQALHFLQKTKIVSNEGATDRNKVAFLRRGDVHRLLCIPSW